jgi:hypothetical protein
MTEHTRDRDTCTIETSSPAQNLQLGQSYTYSGSNSRFEGTGASPLFLDIVVENGAAETARCEKAGRTKLEATGLAIEAARICLEADLRGRIERLSDDIVKPRSFVAVEGRRNSTQRSIGKEQMLSTHPID